MNEWRTRQVRHKMEVYIGRTLTYIEVVGCAKGKREADWMRYRSCVFEESLSSYGALTSIIIITESNYTFVIIIMIMIMLG